MHPVKIIPFTQSGGNQLEVWTGSFKYRKSRFVPHGVASIATESLGSHQKLSHLLLCLRPWSVRLSHRTETRAMGQSLRQMLSARGPGRHACFQPRSGGLKHLSGNQVRHPRGLQLVPRMSQGRNALGWLTGTFPILLDGRGGLQVLDALLEGIHSGNFIETRMAGSALKAFDRSFGIFSRHEMSEGGDQSLTILVGKLSDQRWLSKVRCWRWLGLWVQASFVGPQGLVQAWRRKSRIHPIQRMALQTARGGQKGLSLTRIPEGKICLGIGMGVQRTEKTG